MNDRGTVSLIRRSGDISADDVQWVNGTLGKLVGYADRFLRILDTVGWGRVALVSDQVMLNGRRCV